MKVSIVIPAFNEVQTIAEVLRRIAAAIVDADIVVIDGGSIDGTRDVLQSRSGITVAATSSPAIRPTSSSRNRSCRAESTASTSSPRPCCRRGSPRSWPLCVVVGCHYSVFVHAVVVLSTLGFLASYELLRRMEGRAAGAVICLLLISSPLEFAQETRMVFSDLPYLFTSTLVLLLVWRLDEQCTAPDAKREGTADASQSAA